MTNASLISEFDREMASTRGILDSVPADRFAWKPHEKSSTLGKLCNHLAAMPALAAAAVKGMAKRMPETDSKAELMEAFDKNLAMGREAIAGATDGHLAETIPALNMTRETVVRTRVLSHMIHHRGQLSVWCATEKRTGCGARRQTASNNPSGRVRSQVVRVCYLEVEFGRAAWGAPAVSAAGKPRLSGQRNRRQDRRRSLVSCVPVRSDSRVWPEFRRVRHFPVAQPSRKQLNESLC